MMIRMADKDDIESIVHHRKSMFADMGLGTEDSRQQMGILFEQWVMPKMDSGEFWTWLACDEDRVVSGVGVWKLDWPPGPVGGDLGHAYIYNVYTEDEYRRRGLARRLMQHTIEDCTQRGIGVIGLHASIFGRALYEELGFTPTNEMRLNVQP